MTIRALRPSRALIFTLGLGVGAAVTTGAIAGPLTVAKDQGPTHARCDHSVDNQAALLGCIGKPSETASAAELFYAGYWLAKSGAYEKALSYLMAADKTDPRVVTYIGFSLRKLGNVSEALPYYAKALKLNPNYNVARAYLGEAHLSKGDVGAAKRELSEIANRCGVHCAEHVDLAGHIEAYNTAQRKNG